jgi:hypothetical protein
MSRELARRAAELGDGALAVTAHVRGATALLELGDSDASRRELHQLERLAEALQQRWLRRLVVMTRATRAYLAGRLEECEALVREGVTMGQGWNEDTAMGTFAMQLLYVRSEQFRLEEAVEVAERLAERYPEVPGARAALALAYAEIKRDATPAKSSN